MRLLASNFAAHVIAFDYSGFGDSGGSPCEQQFNRDARDILQWVRKRVANDSDVVLYGQSLGTFAAVDLAAHIAELPCGGRDVVRAVVLDAPPASLIDAAMTHPAALLFRVVPGMRRIFRAVLKDRFDSEQKIASVRVPVLILHGKLDGMIAFEQGKRLHERAVEGGHEEAEFVAFPRAGHIDVNASPNYLRVVHEFLDKHMTAKCESR